MNEATQALRQQALGAWYYIDAALGFAIQWLPKLVAALAILLFAYVIARSLSYGAKYIVQRTPVGNRETDAGENLAAVISRAVFYVVMLISLPAVLGTLGLSGLIQPLEAMATRFLEFLPNLFGALLIFGIGIAVARIAQRTMSSVLEAAQIDHFAEKLDALGLRGKTGLAQFAGVLVFTLLIIPVSVAALDALAIKSIADPAKRMLSQFMEAIPNVFAATIVLTLAYVIARFASDSMVKLLPALGVDSVGAKLGLSREVFAGKPLSNIAGMVAFAAIMIFGIVEGAKLLNFSIVSELLAHVLTVGGQILLGVAIIAIGVVAADFLRTVLAKSKDASPVAELVRIAVIVLAVAMGLRQMGVADEIVHIGFTLMLGALALGAAIAIGWGGKDTAGRLLEKWTKNL